MAPMRPALTSATSSKCEWYIHRSELGSAGPGPARSVTCHTNVQLEPGGMMSSFLSRPARATAPVSGLRFAVVEAAELLSSQ